MKEAKDDLAEGIGLLKALTGGSINGNSTIHVNVNAGSVGVWVSATCCLILLAVTIVGSLIAGLWLTREFTRIDVTLSERKEENDRAQTYLSSIFGRIPELREKIDQEKKKESKSDGSERSGNSGS